ncbi:MAG: gluconate 2-dehydrogenase subunit 3 family protein [Cyclobacteriaceae bacterium]|nr:gluconate 2-dehydrogenase subunit 3 family protein [Cyclobacteriaceae bacterium]
MKRREAIKRTSLMVGASAAAPALLSLIKGCTPARVPTWKAKAFTEQQSLTVEDVLDIIMPKTATPGALELDVHKFIDDMVSIIFKEEKKKAFLQGLDALDNTAGEKHGSVFSACTKEQKIAILTEEDKGGEDKVQVGGRPFFAEFKSLATTGYFRTEVGCTQVKKHVGIPGRWDACIALEDNQPVWAE